MYELTKSSCLPWLALLLATVFCSCSNKSEQTVAWEVGIEVSEDTVSYLQVLGEPVQGLMVVKDDIDLKNRRCCLPKDVTLRFQGGVIKNGTLVGDGTRIENCGICFDRVRILGTWDVPEISTSMFKDLDYDNSLKDVVALASPKIKNRIVIDDGDYQVSAQRAGDVCLPLGGNTGLVINGIIHLTPNDYPGCYVIQAIGEKITIHGNGTIIGDKHTHTGDTGEWGMGISLRNAHYVTINGLTIKDCWGDCIYIDDESTDVKIENCTLDHGRRQGISVVYADGVTIRDCTITNVSGTNPEYAIDVEPDAKKSVDHVTIENVTVRDCKGGFVVYGRANDARVGKVTIRNSKVSADYKITIDADKCDTIVVENCDITQHNTWGCIACKEVGHVEIKDNTLHYDRGVMARLKDWVRPRFGKKRVKVMKIEDCKETYFTQNVEQKL